MKKKRADHIGARGIRLRARGYTINASPGPTIKQQYPIVNCTMVSNDAYMHIV